MKMYINKLKDLDSYDMKILCLGRFSKIYQSIIDKIINTVEINDKSILEIGPGTGSLTNADHTLPGKDTPGAKGGTYTVDYLPKN